MRIALISTGGTIAMAQKEGAQKSSLALDAKDFVNQLLLGAKDEIEIVEFSKLPSSNFDSEYAHGLADLICRTAERSGGIIITHGTDTVEETSFYVEMIYGSPTPVVFTGAMMTATQPGYDGLSNLRDAYRVVTSQSSRGRGALIVFNKDILSAIHASKVESERANAFGSVQTGKIGSINGQRILYYYEPKGHIRLQNNTTGKVSLLKMHYDIETDFVEKAFEITDIIVIECYGSGRIPPKILPIIEHNDDKIIILTTRVPGGHLYDEYSYDGSFQDLLQRRVIMSPLNSIKSCLLGRLCLGNGKDYEETKRIFEYFWQQQSES
ncbi:MAG: asparaginase [Deltaproteobacteria bacterium]|nr:MAG: asparaginase [Deltaproteobacteria bacterium]